MAELEVKNLHVRVEGKEILKGLDLEVEKGRIHALMGPNGSGKSTLANVIMGHPDYEVTAGKIVFQGTDITSANADERARMGLFMAFQYPVAIPGVPVAKYLRMIVNARREARGEDEVKIKDFRRQVEAAMELIKMPKELTSRYLNEGFSGGEKKRMEILQMVLLQPKYAFLDETDSGLDVDAIKIVSESIKKMKKDMGIIIITHYKKFLEYLNPDEVSVLYQGKIIANGGRDLVEKIEKEGFEKIINK